MRDTPEWRNWQTRLTQNQVLRSVGSSPTSGTHTEAAGKFETFPPLFLYLCMPIPSHSQPKVNTRKHKKPPPSHDSSRPGGDFYTSGSMFRELIRATPQKFTQKELAA